MTITTANADHQPRQTVRDDKPAWTLSNAGKQRILDAEGGPMLINDWLSALFIHYEVDAKYLQLLVPYPLDLYNGKAYVSIVAFAMDHLRLSVGGHLTRWMTSPVNKHPFLNVRTYVKHDGEPAIYFLAEWLPNALSVFVGPRMFGLPYRLGKLHYEHDETTGNLRGCVQPSRNNRDHAQLQYHAICPQQTNFTPCQPESLDAFLLERYSCFTWRRGVKRRFRVWHRPWPQTRVHVDTIDDSLLHETGDWHAHAHRQFANYSPRCTDVWVGRPTCVSGPGCQTTWRAPLPTSTRRRS